MQIIDILRFGGEVGYLLGELDLGLFELLESVLESFHKVTILFIIPTTLYLFEKN